jgi:ABC-type polar amino acid transport system ATPase subunit
LSGGPEWYHPPESASLGGENGFMLHVVGCKCQRLSQVVLGQASCLLVSHDRDFVRTVGNRFWLIEGKKLVELEGPEGFFASAGATG